VTNESIVLLLNEAIVVGVAGSTAGEEEVGGCFFEEADELIVKELGAIVWVQFEDREGDTGEDAAESVLHNAVTASQDSYSFAPAGGDIEELDG
jgi:hypothetical protein